MAKAVRKQRWATAAPTRNEQYDARRIALIREAAKAFTARGYHNTSLDDVAESLNVTKPALYYYVKTKHEILLECYNTAFDFGVQARNFADENASTPIERLRLYLKTYTELMARNTHVFGVMSEPLSSLPEEHRQIIRSRRSEADRALRKLIEDNIEAGSIPPCDPRMAVAFFLGAILHISRWYLPESGPSSKEIAETYTEFILNGLQGATRANHGRSTKAAATFHKEDSRHRTRPSRRLKRLQS